MVIHNQAVEVLQKNRDMLKNNGFAKARKRSVDKIVKINMDELENDLDDTTGDTEENDEEETTGSGGDVDDGEEGGDDLENEK